MSNVTHVEIFEHPNTHGVGWRIPGETKSRHWGFRGTDVFSPRVATWIDAQRDPIDVLLNTRVKQVKRMPDTPGAYGGTKKHVLVDVQFLNEYCTEYWEDRNAEWAARRPGPRTCHYCGLPGTGTGSSNEPVCDGCSN